MRRRRNWPPKGPCGLSSLFEYKGCFKTPRSTFPWGPNYFTDNNTKFRGQERSCGGFRMV